MKSTIAAILFRPDGLLEQVGNAFLTVVAVLILIDAARGEAPGPFEAFVLLTAVLGAPMMAATWVRAYRAFLGR